MGHNEEAVTVAQRAIDIDPDNEACWARKGQALRRRQLYQEALEAYNRALELNDAYGWAWNGKGLTLAALEDWAAALDCHERATTLNSNDVCSGIIMAKPCFKLKRYEDAITAYNHALEIDANHDAARQRRTEARHLLERLTE